MLNLMPTNVYFERCQAILLQRKSLATAGKHLTTDMTVGPIMNCFRCTTPGRSQVLSLFLSPRLFDPMELKRYDAINDPCKC